MKVSIIIPVYNVAKYLRQCLDSIVSQTMLDFEVILVDDGSTDSSATIMAEYVKHDHRFKTVRHKHSNAGASRNIGMSLAQGEYLAFLDSDDIFSPHLLKILLDGAERFGADVSCCAYVEFMDGEKVPELSADTDVQWDDCTLDCPERPNYDIATACTWNKLYRRKYIESTGLKYVEQPTTNDATFVWAAVAAASKVIKTDATFVAYRRRKNSIQDRKSKYPECNIVANIELSNEMTRLGVFEKKPWVYEHYRIVKPSSYLDYLSTMRGLKAYNIAYNLLRDDLMKTWSPEGLLSVKNDTYTRRASEILRNSLKENLRRTIEGVLSPLLGQYNYSFGFKRKIIYIVRSLIQLLFDFGPSIRHIPIVIRRRLSTHYNKRVS